MNLFKALSVALLILATLCQPAVNPNGIESTTVTIIPTAITSSFVATFGSDPNIPPTSTPYIGIAIIEESSAPRQQYKIVPTLLSLLATAATYNVTISLGYVRISFSLLMSIGEPCIPVVLTLQTTAQGNQVILIPGITTFPNTNTLKVDTLIAGFDYVNSGNNTGKSICIKPLQQTINATYNDFLTDVSLTTSQTLAPPVTLVGGVLQLAYTLSYSPQATLNTLIVTVIFHSLIQRAENPTIVTGYNVTSLTSPTMVQIINSLTNTLSVPNPTKIFGMSCIQFPDNSPSGINIKIDLPQAQTEWVNSTTGFTRVDTGDYMYANRVACTAPTPVSNPLFSCSLLNPLLSCILPVIPAVANSVKLVIGGILQTSATITYGSAVAIPAVVEVQFNVSVPDASSTIERLEVSITGGALPPVSFSLLKSATGIPAAGSRKITFSYIATGAFTHTLTFTLSAAFLSGLSLANVNINNVKIFVYPDIPSFPDGNVAGSCIQPTAIVAPLPGATPIYFDPNNPILAGNVPMYPIATRACAPTTTSNACNCPNGFFATPASITCLRCQQPFCTTCNAANPAVCVGNCDFNRVLQADGSCACPAGQVSNPLGPCITCNYQCSNCDTSLSCLNCTTVFNGVQTNRTPNPVQGLCPCTDGFYDNGSPVCQACPTPCRTCATIGSSQPVCTSCKLNGNTKLVGGACVCLDGFAVTVPNDGTCYKCHITCSTCQGPSPSDCKSCPATRSLSSTILGSGACYCLPGFTEQNPQTADCAAAACAALTPGCVNCTGTVCTTCSAALNRVATAVGGICQCVAGYFANTATGTCDPCGPACAICTSSSSCTTCYTNATTSSGVCSCPSGTSPIAATTTCSPCSVVGCSVCPSNTCTACANPWIYVNGQCSCPDGFYLNNGVCSPCTSGCRFCNSTGCMTCNTGMFLSSGVCLSTCPASAVSSGNQCFLCAPNCQVCSQPTVCSQCIAPWLLINGGCVSSCPSGTVANPTNTACLLCASPCATCSSNTTTCTSCLPSVGSLFGNTCVTQCPAQTTSVAGVCVACNSGCTSCFGSPNVCGSCTPPLLLSAGSCINICPPGTLMFSATQCVVTCPDGTFASGSICAQCSSACVACQGVANSCTRCPLNFYLFGGNCLPTCPVNTIPSFGTNGGVCQTCLPNCAVCSSVTTCQTCASNNFQLVNGRCVQCFGSTVVNTVTGVCDPCPANCVQCTNATFCNQCAAPALTVNGQCTTCLSPCATCAGGPLVCATCVSGYALVGTTCSLGCPTADQTIVNGVCQCRIGVLSNTACVSACPTGNGPDVNKICVNCSSNCDICAGSASICTQCRLGYGLVNGSCIQSSGCAFGQALVGGVCVRMCASGRFFFDNFCVDICPSGYAPNADYSGCVLQANTNTPCQIGQVYAFGQCYSICPAGTYTVGNVCVACPSNCMTCTNNTYCVDCAAGYYYSAGKCLLSAICAAPQLSLGQNCVNSCPEGTYSTSISCERLCGDGLVYSNGLCYSICPGTLFSNGYGCVPNCPAGQTPLNGVCTGQGSSSCGSGFFFSTTLLQCVACQAPCATCVGTPNICTSCLVGTAVSGRCQGTNVGTNSVVATVNSASISGNQLEIVVGLNFIPPNLSTAQQSQIFQVSIVPSAGTVQVFQWVDIVTSTVHVLLIFPSPPSSSTLVFGTFNVAALASSYIASNFNNFSQASFQTSVANATPASVNAAPLGAAATLARTAATKRAD